MKKTHASLDVIAGLILFCIFTVTMLFVLVSGAGAYQNISETMEEQYRERTCLHYIAAKIRHFDDAGQVYVGDFAGQNALYLEEELDGVAYSTVLYAWNGSIRELFTIKGTELAPDDGFEIIRADGITFTEPIPGLICSECEVDGRTAGVCVAVRSERTAAP